MRRVSWSRVLTGTVSAVLMCAQTPVPNSPPTFSTTVYTFGTTTVIPGGLTGEIYALPEGARSLPNFKKLEPLGKIYTRKLWVPPRDFSEGFPGVTDRIEWFAIDFNGRFYVADPGTYWFSIRSDDGSKLYIDNKQVINADGVGWLSGEGSVKLATGVHQIRVSYFQGPRYHLYLMLSVKGPNAKSFRVFDTDEFRPPSDLAEWTTGAPADMADPVRRNMKNEGLRSDPAVPVVPLSLRVVAGGRPVLGLTKEDFVVRDGNQVQNVTTVAFNSQPLDIELLIDTSPTMEQVRKRLQDQASSAGAELNRADRVGILEFSETMNERLLLTANRTQFQAALRPGDNTPSGARLKAMIGNDAGLRSTAPGVKELNSALAVTAQALRERTERGARRAIVIVTDNQGAKGIPDGPTRDALWRLNVIVCAVIAGSGPSEADVRPFAAATGGEVFPDIDLAAAFRSIRDRYLLTYVAPGGEPKTIHLISVDLSPAAKARYPDARVLVRGGYVVGEEGE
jgi:hypothetical protein